MFEPSFDQWADYEGLLSDDGVLLEDCKILAKSAKALKVLYGEEEIWLPFSQMYGDYAQSPLLGIGTTVTLEITYWLARTKGLGGYKAQNEEP
jgi:hypothetical protein